MRKFFYIVLLYCSTLYADAAYVDMRAVYVNYDYDRGFSDSRALVSSLKLGFNKDINPQLQIGAAVASVQDFGFNDKPDAVKMSYIFDKDYSSYRLLQQLYLKYKFSKTLFEIGRFELETPLISADDYFLLSNTFEGLHVDIGEIENYLFRIGYIDKMSGAWDSAYDGGTFESMTKQAWIHRADTTTEHYYNGVNDLGIKNAGLAYCGVDYTNKDTRLQLYEHILIDAYISLFTQIDHIRHLDDKQLLLAAQYIRYNGIGALRNNPNPEAVVNYATYSAKAKISTERYSIQAAYTGVSDTSSLHFFGSFGAYSEFASGMMVTYFSTSLRDADIYTISSSLKFHKQKHSLKLSALYAYYDLNPLYTDNGIIGDSVHGDSYMHTYGTSAEYKYNKNFSFVTKIAQRVLEHGDKNLLFRTIIGYKF